MHNLPLLLILSPIDYALICLLLLAIGVITIAIIIVSRRYPRKEYSVLDEDSELNS